MSLFRSLSRFHWTFFIAIGSFVAWPSIAAAQQIPQIVIDEVCTCMGQGKSDAALQEECFGKILATHEATIVQALQLPEGISEVEKGEQIMGDHRRGLLKQLIMDCDPYFQYFTKVRNSWLPRKENNHAKEMEAVNQKISNNTNDAIALTERGYRYLAAKDYEKAETDFRAALKIGQKTGYALFGLATVLEMQGKYSDALINYRTAYEQSEKREVGILILFVQRLQRDQANGR